MPSSIPINKGLMTVDLDNSEYMTKQCKPQAAKGAWVLPQNFCFFSDLFSLSRPCRMFFLANSPFANIPAAAILAHLHSHPNSSRFFRNVRLGRLHRDDGESHQGCGAARQGDQVQMGLLPARLIAREYPLKRIALESPRCFSSWHIGIVHCSRVPQPIEFPLDVWVTWF